MLLKGADNRCPQATIRYFSKYVENLNFLVIAKESIGWYGKLLVAMLLICCQVVCLVYVVKWCAW